MPEAEQDAEVASSGRKLHHVDVLHHLAHRPALDRGGERMVEVGQHLSGPGIHQVDEDLPPCGKGLRRLEAVGEPQRPGAVFHPRPEVTERSTRPGALHRSVRRRCRRGRCGPRPRTGTGLLVPAGGEQRHGEQETEERADHGGAGRTLAQAAHPLRCQHGMRFHFFHAGAHDRAWRYALLCGRSAADPRMGCASPGSRPHAAAGGHSGLGVAPGRAAAPGRPRAAGSADLAPAPPRRGGGPRRRANTASAACARRGDRGAAPCPRPRSPPLAPLRRGGAGGGGRARRRRDLQPPGTERGRRAAGGGSGLSPRPGRLPPAAPTAAPRGKPLRRALPWPEPRPLQRAPAPGTGPPPGGRRAGCRANAALLLPARARRRRGPAPAHLRRDRPARSTSSSINRRCWVKKLVKCMPRPRPRTA